MFRHFVPLRKRFTKTLNTSGIQWRYTAWNSNKDIQYYKKEKEMNIRYLSEIKEYLKNVHEQNNK